MMLIRDMPYMVKLLEKSFEREWSALKEGDAHRSGLEVEARTNTKVRFAEDLVKISSMISREKANEIVEKLEMIALTRVMSRKVEELWYL